MGGKNTKQLNESISTAANEAIIENATTSTGSVFANQRLVISGKVSNSSFIQEAKINLSVLKNSTVLNNTNNEMKDKILTSLKEERSNFPEIGKSSTEMETIVEKHVKTTFTQKNINNLQLTVEANQDIEITPDSVIEGSTFKQSAEGIAKMVDEMSSKIVNELVTDTELESTMDTKTKFFAAELVDSVGNAATNIIGSVADLFGLDISTILIIAFVLLIVLYIYITSDDETQQKMRNGPGNAMQGMQRGMQGMQRGPGGMQGGPGGMQGMQGMQEWSRPSVRDAYSDW
jgi:hypothetical protein